MLFLCTSLISSTFSFQGSGALICSIDNMPAQIPKEATDFFGNLLLPYIPDMVYYFTYLIILYDHVINTNSEA